MARAKRVGLTTILNQIYSVSPKHTDDITPEAREAAALKPDYICLKDPGGLLTPERTGALIKVIQTEAPGLPIELHVHCTTGLGPLCAIEAIKLGVELIDVSVPPLANASSNPSVFNVAQNSRALGHTPVIDEQNLKSVARDLTYFAKRASLPIGEPVEYDYSQYVHQVPGGMISNLRFQLKNLGLLDRLPEVLEEAILVRKDLGYPIMVTPFSQFVGSQAAINVIKGERYIQVTDQVIQYAPACGAKKPHPKWRTTLKTGFSIAREPKSLPAGSRAHRLDIFIAGPLVAHQKFIVAETRTAELVAHFSEARVPASQLFGRRAIENPVFNVVLHFGCGFFAPQAGWHIGSPDRGRLGCSAPP